MDINEKLREKENFFFDLDRTIWDWESPVIGAEDLIHNLKKSDKKIRFHTDNTLLSREAYAKKLSSMGINTEKEDIFTAGYAVGKLLSENMVNKAYVIGESGLINDLEENGIKITDKAETVVMGFDRQFNYNKIQKAFNILKDGGRVYICSNEKVFKSSNYETPHQGVFNPVFDQFENRKLVGKPSDIFVDQFEDYFDYLSAKSVFIGDRLEDIETGNKLDMMTGAVMSGSLTKPKLAKADSDQKPDFGIPSLHRLRRRLN